MESLLNDSTEAFGLFVAFKLNGYNAKRCRLFLQVSALVIFFAVGFAVQSMTIEEHLCNHGQATTIPAHLIANDFHMLFWNYRRTSWQGLSKRK